MSESTQRKLDLVVGTTYHGGGLKSATADVEKLRQQMALPVMGPLGRQDQAVENAVVSRIRAMERAAEKARVKSRVDELMFGLPTGPAQKAARFSAEEQTVRDQMAARIRAMREATRKANIGEEVTRRLFGGGASDTSGLEKQAKAIRIIGEEARKAEGALANLGYMFRKFGTSSGTDPLIERLVKIAPAIGTTLAVAKTASIGMEFSNLAGDFSRHNAQGNLERQVADEGKLRESLTSIPILGYLGEQMQKNRYFGQKVADVRKLVGFDEGKYAGTSAANQQIEIEELETALKAQDRLIQGMERRVAIGKQLREQALALIDGNRLAVEKGGRTGAFGDMVDARERVRLLDKRIADLPKDVKAPQEMRDQRDVLFGDFIRKSIRGYAAEITSKVSPALDKGAEKLGRFAGAVEFAASSSSRIREMRLRADGRNFEADVEGVRERTRQRILENPRMRRRIEEEGREEESALAKRHHRELLDQREEFQQRMAEVDRGHAERRLRLAGKSLEADKLQLVNALEAQVAEIRTRYEKQIRENPVEAATLRGRAARELGAAGADFALSRAEMLRERAMRFLPGETSPGITGESRLATGAVGRGELEAARARDLMLRQLKAQEDVAAAMKELPAKVAEAFKGAMEAMGFGPSDPSEYPWSR